MGTAQPSARAEIAAPIDEVWAVMLDTASYAAWNPFVVQADCPAPPSVGDRIVLHVRWKDGSGTTSPERITAIDAPAAGADGVRRACLSYVYEGLPSRLGLIKGVRHQRLTQTPGGPTVYETVEKFSGPFVKYAGPGRVAEGFSRHAAALKQRCEGG